MSRVSSVPSCSQAPLGQDCCCCKRCDMGGCDLKIMDCGCCMHARCCPISEKRLLVQCPVCFQPARSVQLMPMAFAELDQALVEAAQTNLSHKRGKKRKNATIARLNANAKESVETEEKGKTSSGHSTELRTGRWTIEETAYCDKLIQLFEGGLLPLPNGVKLNDFLASMLKSKQSRLTKKMKNARLSTRSYNRTLGFILNDHDAREFSQLETEFFASIRCRMERSEIRFHMQKEWRELFSSYCVNIGQTLDADSWLSSVEEIDRRASQTKDAARMARRKFMMGNALSEDASNPQNGVFIDPNGSLIDKHVSSDLDNSRHFQSLPALTEATDIVSASKRQKTAPPPLRKTDASPFIARVVHYLQRHGLPFEHVDAWVPSFVPDGSAPMEAFGAEDNDKINCRLCFAGCATTEMQVPANGGQGEPVCREEQFDLVSFGEYSQKFSFDVGCGLPGRVYSSGVPSWERGIHNAPAGQFERCGGAKQWGIQTVLGVPIPSPTVGRMVVLFYSVHDRPRSQDTVQRITEELTRLMPSPKWKLVVEIGVPPKTSRASQGDSYDVGQANELLTLINEHMPLDKTDSFAPFLPGFTSLNLVLVKRSRSPRENKLLRSALAVFTSHKQAGHSEGDVAWMTARDYMLLSSHRAPQLLEQLSSSAQSNDAASSTGSFHRQLQLPQEHYLGHPSESACADVSGNSGEFGGLDEHSRSSSVHSRSSSQFKTAQYSDMSQGSVPMSSIIHSLNQQQQNGAQFHNPAAMSHQLLGGQQAPQALAGQNDAAFLSNLGFDGIPAGQNDLQLIANMGLASLLQDGTMPANNFDAM